MSKIETGTIFSIPLPKKRGFCYGKYLHLPEITGHTYDSHLFKVYDYFTDKVDDRINNIVASNLLYCPILLFGTPKIRGLGWTIIGKHNSEYDNFYPDYKDLRGNKWIALSYYKSNDESEFFDIEYKRISHLELCILRSLLEIPERILMELIRKEGKSIEKELDFENDDKEMLSTFEKMKEIPIYSKIPEKYKGRILPQGIELKLLD